MKKISLAKACAWLVAMLASTTTVMAYDVKLGGIYYNANTSAKTLTVTSGDDLYTGTVTIPATVTYNNATYMVTAIAPLAFQNCIHLTGVNIGSNVTNIGYQAFLKCEELQSIVIPDGVTKFDVMSTVSGSSYYNRAETFDGCIALETVTIGAKVANMGSGVFQNCTALKNVTIKSGCTIIGPTCFKGCTKIASVTIPNTVKNIAYGAFQNCTALKSISIPNSVTTIGYNAFYGCI